MMTMELRNRVQSAVQVKLSVADLLAGLTVDELTVKILDAMEVSRAPVAMLDGGAAWEEGSL